MARASVLAIAALLFAGCRLGAAGPDDEQVLVQRSASVQERDLEVERGVMGSRLAFSRQVHNWTRKVREELRKREEARRNDDPRFGTSGEICTEEEMQAFNDARKAYEKAQKDGGIAFRKHVLNHTIHVLKKVFNPLISAGNAILEDSDENLRPPVANLVKYYIVQALKPKKTYGPGDLAPPPEQSRKEIGQVVESSAARWKDIISKSWAELDKLLNKSAEEMEVPTAELNVSMGKSPVVDWEKNTSNLQEYFLYKALPIIGLEVLPQLMGPIRTLVSALDFKTDDMIQSMMDSFQAIVQLGTQVDKDASAFQPDIAKTPERVCQTCEEQYNDAISTVGTTGCMGFCTEVLDACSTAVDKQCVRSAHSCIACHGDKLATLDACIGDSKHKMSVARLRFVASQMKRATTQQGFDYFLGNTSMMLLGGDRFLADFNASSGR